MSSALFIYAHPDDETFGAAGTICLLRAKGWRVVLACATLGDKGKCGEPALCAPEDLAATRERELRDAACVLDISEIHLLGYKDKELGAAPPDEIRRKLVGLIRAEKPEAVFSFDPNGFNVHPDHVAISRFASDAVAAAADARWYPELGEPHTVDTLLWTTPLEPWEEAEGDAREKAGVDMVLDVSEWADKKQAALQAHRTQHKSVEHHFLSKPNLKEILGVETWRKAWPAARALFMLAALLIAGDASAQSRDAKTFLSGGVGIMGVDLPHAGDPEPAFTVRLARRLPASLALEGAITHTNVERQFGRFGMTAFDGQLQYHLQAGRFTPYFGAGLGMLRDGSETPGDSWYPLSLEGWDLTASFTGGTRVTLNERFGLFGEARVRRIGLDFSRGTTVDAMVGLAIGFK